MSGRAPTLGPAELVYQDPYQQVYRQMADFGAFKREYFMTRYGARASVVVVRGEDVLLCRQYRRLWNGLTWEIPGGKVDAGETPESAAIRECLEETGIRCLKVHALVQYNPGSDIIDNPTHIFFSRRFIEEPKSWTTEQEVEPPVWISLSRCLGMIFARDIVDGMTVASLLAYHTFTMLGNHDRHK